MVDQNGQDNSATNNPVPQVSGTNPPAQQPPVSSGQASNQADAPVEVSLPGSAKDSDLIEKEWVDKAKQIVAHTRDDPYEQQRAMNLMKAEYMKKRYNKDIKIEE